MVRTEEELDIDERRFESLWPLTEGRRVSKTRHLIPLDSGLAAELDVYRGAHDGLLTAEIEFPSLEASEAFPPGWLGREVTGDRRFANQALALDGRPPSEPLIAARPEDGQPHDTRRPRPSSHLRPPPPAGLPRRPARPARGCSACA